MKEKQKSKDKIKISNKKILYKKVKNNEQGNHIKFGRSLSEQKAQYLRGDVLKTFGIDLD